MKSSERGLIVYGIALLTAAVIGATGFYEEYFGKTADDVLLALWMVAAGGVAWAMLIICEEER